MKEFKPEEILSKRLFEKELINLKEGNDNAPHFKFIEDKSVLGIDIYRYSEYPENIQVYVPVLFNELYKSAVENCIKKEEFFFQKYGSAISDFENKFISTGDGGFQIFENPMQTLIFTIYFQSSVLRFNSNHLANPIMENLVSIVGRIELRYTFTFDKVYCYRKNFFGPAIINNARILSKDNLNRLLIDFPTLKWFIFNMNTMENLMIITKTEISKIKCFEDYDVERKSQLFEKADRIKSLDILKIGTIKSKNIFLEIYNLRIQTLLTSAAGKSDFKRFLTTIGNLNIQGIE